MNWLTSPLPTRSVFAVLVPNLESKFFADSPGANVQGEQRARNSERSRVASPSSALAPMFHRIGLAMARSTCAGAAPVRGRGIRPLGNDGRRPHRAARARRARVRQEGAAINPRQANDNIILIILQPETVGGPRRAGLWTTEGGVSARGRL
jgi:hypothetical protein